MTLAESRIDAPQGRGASGAPFHADVAEAPPGARAVWLYADDGVRLRLGYLGHGTSGTVLLFPGRTEYVEKYGQAAAAFAARGYGTVAVDWRGQGLADRVMDDPMIGHVRYFADYQRDVAAVMAALRGADLPRPWVLLGHSMGGAIGLRALVRGLDVSGAVFSAPLWGIAMASALRPVAWGLGWMAHRAGADRLITPGTKYETYVRLADPHDNLLTHDPGMMAYMRRHLDAVPGLALGGPSIPWLYRALVECRDLRRHAEPAVPTLTFLPGAEKIVDAGAIRQMTGRWRDARLVVVEGGEHETMMETRDRREMFFDECAGFFAGLK